MFELNISGQKDVDNVSTLLSIASINVEFVEDPDWTEFKFITKKKGAQGPTKGECNMYYYNARYVFNYHSSNLKVRYT